MKKIAILFSILVVVLLIAPGLVGFKAQDRYLEIVSGLEQLGLEITRSDYRRGWFGSRAETEFTLALPTDLELPAFKLSMYSDIVHGPLSPDGGVAMAAISTYFKVNDAALFPEGDNHILNSRISLDGNGKTLIEIPAIKLSGQPGEPEIQFSGAEGEILFDTSFTQLGLDLAVPALWLGGGAGQSLKVSDVTLSSRSNSGHSSLSLGSGKLGIKQIDFVNPRGGMKVRVEAVDLFGDTREEGGNLGFSATYTMQALAVNDMRYGPAELQIDFGNIAAAAAAQLKQGMQDIRQQKLSQQERGMAIISMLMGVGPELLRANPKIAIKRLFVKTPHGDIEGQITLTADGLKWDEVGDRLVLLRKLNADGSVRLPETLLRGVLEIQAQQGLRQHFAMRIQTGEIEAMPSEQEIQTLGHDMIQQRLEGLLQQGLLIRDGEYLSSSAKLEGGLLRVNGKSVPLF